MKIVTLLVLCLGAFGVLLPIAFYVNDEVLGSPGRQHLTLSDWLHEERRRPQLEADKTTLSRIIGENVVIIDALIEGRLSLRAAADALRALRESKPAHLCSAEDHPPQQLVEEYFVRRAFRGAEVALRDDPRRDAILERLQAELDDFLCAQEAQP
jgi:hypothetical protein